MDPRSVQGYSMGEHGDSQMVPWSMLQLEESQFYEILKDNKDRVGEVDLDKLVLETARAGWEVYNRKGQRIMG
ncbi:malate/lactate dehydrogenase [Clostridium beijerinckii]|nr:malate/lactate dehydrogenase [Clostridium beijerinckii]